MVIVFPYGTCAICEGGLPKRSRERVICDSRECRLELMRFAGKRGQATKRQVKAERAARGVKWCSRCRSEKSATTEHFSPARRAADGSVVELSRYCRECQRSYRRENVALVSAAQRRWRDKVLADPVRHEASLEARRIRQALRRERDGKPLRTRVRHEREVSEQLERNHLPSLPARPLGEAVMRRARIVACQEDIDKETVVAGWGGSLRSVSAWATGDRELVQFDVADALLTNAGLHPWDVWDDPAVLAVFERGPAKSLVT